MSWIVYVGAGVALLLFVGFFGALLVASLIDLYHYRKNRLFIELQRDYTKRRRPAAK